MLEITFGRSTSSSKNYSLARQNSVAVCGRLRVSVANKIILKKSRIRFGEMVNQLTRNTIISLLKAEKSYLTKEFGVVNIGLFGAFARDRLDRDSDIDLIVELREPRFDYLAGLQIYLEKNSVGK